MRTVFDGEKSHQNWSVVSSEEMGVSENVV
jgi:hypothetical protein